MPHTPLFDRLVEVFRVAGESVTTGTPVAALRERAAARHSGLIVSRRAFVAGAAAAGGTLVGWPTVAGAARFFAAPRIAVVGGGLAGLTCAYRLKQAGLLSTVYEASERLGGRCWTRRGDFADGQIVEHGGELIDQVHKETRQLAQELGLVTDNLLAAEQNGTDPLYYFAGAPYTFDAATDDVKQIWQALHADLSAASYPTTFDSFTAAGAALDRMSILDWINTRVPGGHASPLGQLLDAAYNIEYGANIDVQSALNLVYLLGFSGQGQFRVFGPSNEKYHVQGGNDQIVARLADQVAGQIETGAPLTAIVRNADGRFTLTFGSGRSTRSVTVDRLVLALPFSILRDQVDWSRAGFSSLKQIAIRELQIGANTKLHLQFGTRLWRTLGGNGDSYADTGYQNTWEVTRAQPGRSGVLVNYTGGDVARTFASGSPKSLATRFLAQIEPVMPGLTAQWNGRVTLDYWPANPWSKGAYSYWRVGQYTRFAGAEYQRSANCHFCGEHTSIDSQGYLNGAVETGQRVAADILADLKVLK